MGLALACSGSFKKRDSGRNDDETLVSRLVDRCLRPVFEKGWANDTQVLRTSPLPRPAFMIPAPFRQAARLCEAYAPIAVTVA